MVSIDPFSSQSIKLLVSPWESAFYDLVEEANEQLLIASPYISSYPLHETAKIIERKSLTRTPKVHIITNLAPDSLLSGSLDISALLNFVQTIRESVITYLPSLHAKVYIADHKVAVITSANLTSGGLTGNREYGVLLRHQPLVEQVYADITKYAALGNRVFTDTLLALNKVAQELKGIRKEVDQSATQKLRLELENGLDAAKLELLKVRAKDKTTHGILSDTILYLLGQKGPLRTTELHPLVQQIHPDLCDDSIDRVIGGVHFGKRWKHYVRNAQQALKRRGLIDQDNRGYWFLKGSPGLKPLG